MRSVFFFSLAFVSSGSVLCSAAIAAPDCQAKFECSAAAPEAAIQKIEMAFEDLDPESGACTGTYAVSTFDTTSPQTGESTMALNDPKSITLTAISRLFDTWEYRIVINTADLTPKPGPDKTFTGIISRRNTGGTCGSAPCGKGPWGRTISMSCKMI